MKNLKNEFHLLCPEYLPLENKGEEAIIRGVADFLEAQRPDIKIIYHIVDLNCTEHHVVDGIHVHPGKLFFSDWRSREFGLDYTLESIESSFFSLLRNGLNRFYPRWILKPHKEAVDLVAYLSGKKVVPLKFKKSIEILKKIDFIMAGHNGGLDEYVCHILTQLKSIGFEYGIFGSCLKPKIRDKYRLNIFEDAFKYSKFNIIRNPIGYRWAELNFKDISFDLKPDPAYAMIPRMELEKEKKIKNKYPQLDSKYIVITVAEPAGIARFSFDDAVGTYQKVAMHRRFLKDLISQIASRYPNLPLIFLPHTVGPTHRMDDRIIAKDIIEHINLDNVFLLDEDLSAAELKWVISNSELIIAERVHSAIGALSTSTPFILLGSKHDNRIRGMMEEFLGAANYIFYLNKPNIYEIADKFDYIYNNHSLVKNEFHEMSQKTLAELNKCSDDLCSIF